MKRTKGIAVGLGAALSCLMAGCGVQAAQASQYIHVQGTVVHLRIVSGFSNSLDISTLDGVQADGHLTISIPKGAEVKMTVVNNGPIPEAFGVYNASWNLAFSGAGDPWYSDVGINPVAGLMPGQSATYTFMASHTGTYTLADLLNNTGTQSDADYTPQSATKVTPVSDIWATFKVTSSGTPSMTTKGNV